MHYEKSNSKATMINSSTSGAGPSWLANHPEIKKTRSYLLILLSIQLIAVLINGVSDIQNCKTNDTSGLKLNQSCNTILYQILIPILFNSFGLLTIYRYYQAGLLVFAWLNVILLIIYGTFLVFGWFIVLFTLATIGFAGVAIVTVIFMSILDISVLSIEIIITKLAFELSNLIETNKYLNIEDV